jgi:hypothetical protein
MKRELVFHIEKHTHTHPQAHTQMRCVETYIVPSISHMGFSMGLNKEWIGLVEYIKIQG